VENEVIVKEQEKPSIKICDSHLNYSVIGTLQIHAYVNAYVRLDN